VAKIFVVAGEKVVQELKAGSEPVKIGRDPANDIQIINPGVSRFHALVYRQGHPWFVEDRESTNGVEVNGVKIKWKQGLYDGDRITIGKQTLVFKFDGDDEPEGKGLDMSHFDPTMVVDKKK
jgi:pSer/pThr/pTyr-binding forkhead associated (FHA) protein